MPYLKKPGRLGRIWPDLCSSPRQSDTRELIMTNKVLASVCVLGLLASELRSHDDTDEGGVYGARQEGNLDAQPARDVQQPYTPVVGDTTGDGMPRDRRTGGGVTGQDVTPHEKINTEKTRERWRRWAQSGGGVTPQ